MTLDEAIKHCEEVAERNDKSAEEYGILARHTGFIYSKLTAEENKKNCEQCAADHRQLAEWLQELKELREQIHKAKSMILDYSYTVEVMCNRIQNTMGCENCTYCDEETYDCEVRAYIARTRSFAKGDRESESD